MPVPPPPVPPPPPREYYEQQQQYRPKPNAPPPVVPPLPQGYVPQDQFAPRLASTEPLSPKPRRVDPNMQANISQGLMEDRAPSADQYGQQRPLINPTPGFYVPQVATSAPYGYQQQQQPQPYHPQSNYRQPSPLPNPASSFQSQAVPSSFPSPSLTPRLPPNIPAQMANLSIGGASASPRRPSATSTIYRAPAPLPSFSTSAPPPPDNSSAPLALPIATKDSLQASMSAVLASQDPQEQLAWCRAVLFLVDKASTHDGEPINGPAIFIDPILERISNTAVPMVLRLASIAPPIPEAVYYRATLAAQGTFPQHIVSNPRGAFRDFEVAARGGYGEGWFKLGRDYEHFNDHTRAKDCYTRGIKSEMPSCFYRMGIAHLLGQLSLPANPTQALPLLIRAAAASTVTCPQPAYVLALMLLNEFGPYQLTPAQFVQFQNPLDEARRHLERAAFLHFAPAQYKLGHAYEFAIAPFPYDALLSVSYYTLASEQGESEADMALSKWFLCGAKAQNQRDWLFEKDEQLAWTFAEKAAVKGLASAEFALGYYNEVGVGGPKNPVAARSWYEKAYKQGNKDAAGRLQALNQNSGATLSRSEHDAITENQLMDKRTEAARNSAKRTGTSPTDATSLGVNQSNVVAFARKTSVLRKPVRADPNAPPQTLNAYPKTPRTANTLSTAVPYQAPPAPAPAAAPPAAESGNWTPSHPRINLSDTGPSAAAPENSTTRRSYERPQFTQRPSQPNMRPPPSKDNAPPIPHKQNAAYADFGAPSSKATTFADLGIQTGKVEEKECLIM